MQVRIDTVRARGITVIKGDEEPVRAIMAKRTESSFSEIRRSVWDVYSFVRSEN